VQRMAWGEGRDARIVRSGALSSTTLDGVSSVEALDVGATPMLLALGARGSETGVGLAAETWQQELFADAS